MSGSKKYTAATRTASQVHRMQQSSSILLQANTPRQPVYGLIFLFQYMGDENETDDEHDASTLWFANQVYMSLYLTPWPH